MTQQSSTDMSEEDSPMDGTLLDGTATDTMDGSLQSKPTANGTAATPSPTKTTTKRYIHIGMTFKGLSQHTKYFSI